MFWGFRKEGQTGWLVQIRIFVVRCCREAPRGTPLTWRGMERRDLHVLFLYMKKDPPPEKLSRLQYLLGINDSLASIIRESGGRSIDAIVEEEEKFVF